MSLLSVENLSVQFHNRTGVKDAVNHISFSIEENEISGLVGESGSGKTTAMLALLGLLPEHAVVSCEQMRLAGEDITPSAQPGTGQRREYERRMERVRGAGISMIFQDPSAYLDDMMPVGRQITETIHAHRKCSSREANEEARELLDMVGITDPERRMKQYPFELSGGMCQRAAIAIALASHPKLLIADEPTTALDATIQGQILELLKRAAKERKTAVLLVSHDLGVVASACRHVMVMREGCIVEDGSADEVFYDPQHPYTRELLACAANAEKPPQAIKREEPVLRLEQVSKSYGVCEAAEKVSFEINKGETFGLVGESGCGKTTVAKLIAGMLKPGSGKVLYRGKEVVVPGRWRGRRDMTDIQMVFQNPANALNPVLTAGEMLEDALLASGKARREECQKLIRKILEQVGIPGEDAGKYPYEFSGGQRQRLVIARALILNPGLLILDEPVSALDLSIQTQILELLGRIQEEKGKELSSLLISHDLSVVKSMSQRIGVMYRGSMVEIGRTAEVCDSPWHPYTKVLLASSLPPDPVRARKKKPAAWRHLEDGGKEKKKRRGCPFAERCGYRMECCLEEKPGMYRFGDREVACFLYSEKYGRLRSSGYKMTSQI